MPKNLSEIRANPPRLFVDLGNDDKAEAEIAVNSVKIAFETLTGQKTDPSAKVEDKPPQPSENDSKDPQKSEN